MNHSPLASGVSSSLRVLTFCCLLSLVQASFGFQEDSVTSLIEAVNSDEPLKQEESLFDLQKLGPKANDAVQPICKLLSSDSFSLRALSVDALVAIGKPSIEPVRHLLNSDSASARAAAIQCLSRLNASSFPDLKRLADDKSERVRASVAIGLSNCNHPESDSLLIQLLDDSEPAVCVQACLAIQSRKSNPETVVPALTRNLDRINAAAVIIDTLGGFGTDAKSAIPKMFEKSSQIREWDEHFNHPIDEALSHIGPPNPTDAKTISSLLLGTKHETNIRIAKSLALLGREGSAAAEDLERVIDEMLQRVAEFDPESPRYNKKRSKLEPWQLKEIVRDIDLTIVACAAALWEVTGDADRFTKIAIKISLGSEWGMFFYSPTPWETFTKTDVLEIKKLLDSKENKIFWKHYL